MSNTIQVQGNITIQKRGRDFAVLDGSGEFICICVYLVGAVTVSDMITQLRAENARLREEVSRCTNLIVEKENEISQITQSEEVSA